MFGPILILADLPHKGIAARDVAQAMPVDGDLQHVPPMAIEEQPPVLV